MRDSCFPYTKFEFVHEIGHKDWIKIEAESAEHIRECILDNYEVSCPKLISACSTYTRWHEWLGPNHVLNCLTDNTLSDIEDHLPCTFNQLTTSLVIYAYSFLPCPLIYFRAEFVNLILADQASWAWAPSKKLYACKEYPINSSVVLSVKLLNIVKGYKYFSG